MTQEQDTGSNIDENLMEKMNNDLDVNLKNDQSVNDNVNLKFDDQLQFKFAHKEMRSTM